jgi:diaminohydroxyphosphoribosylaminopyrimidine deaminase/5-amino-6-(5-phosphoribosylamino)uracil reductase
VLVLTVRPDARRRRALEARGVVVVEVGGRGGRVSLPHALRALRRFEIASVMVEGGGEVLGAFLRAGLFDKVTLFRAPALLGGRGSRSAFAGPDPERVSQAVRLEPGAPSWVDAVELGGSLAELGCEHWYAP